MRKLKNMPIYRDSIHPDTPGLDKRMFLCQLKHLFQRATPGTAIPYKDTSNKMPSSMVKKALVSLDNRQP